MFTFKTVKPKGKWKSFEQDSHLIKVKGKQVGLIYGEGSFSDRPPFKIRLMIIKKDIMEDGNPNCEWKWITLKYEGSSLQDAKDFLNAKFTDITKKWELRKMEDYHVPNS